MKLYSRAMSLRFVTSLSAATLISAVLASPALAQNELDSINVTANRMPTETALAPSSVITRDDIERLQINELPVLLSRLPGIDMTQNGGYGKNSGISIRGNATDHVLVLVDGVKWQSATSGGSALQDFPVEQIERIEVIRGPRSGLYGSEAIGGVIQIFTRQGKAGKVTPYFSAGVGSKNTQKATAGVSGGDENTRYNLSYSYLTTNGIDARETYSPDHDGYRNRSLSFNVDHQITDDWSVGAHLLRAEGHNDYDGSAEPIYGESVQQILGVNTAVAINDMWTMSLDLNESRDRLDSYQRGEFYSRFNTRHRAINWLNTLTLAPQQRLNIGVDYDHDAIESDSQYDETSRDNKGVFISWQGAYEKHDWFISARHDDNEAFGHRSTGTADYGYRLTDDLRVTANIGTGFKAPTFNDLYYPMSGNPDVNPEKSTSYGIGLEGTPTWGNWSVNAYQNKVRDLIAWAPEAPGSFIWRPFNVDEAKIKGIEFDINTVLAGWQVGFNASILKPEDEKTGDLLPRRAQQLANLSVDKQWGDWSTGASWKLRGHSYDTDGSRIGGYGLVDLRLAYQVTSDWSVRLTGQNMLDQDYQTINTYNSLGRTVMFSVHYQPE